MSSMIYGYIQVSTRDQNCGSKELIEISDEVLKEQIRATTLQTISQKQFDTQLQIKQMELEAKKKKQDERSGLLHYF